MILRWRRPREPRRYGNESIMSPLNGNGHPEWDYRVQVESAGVCFISNLKRSALTRVPFTRSIIAHTNSTRSLSTPLNLCSTPLKLDMINETAPSSINDYPSVQACCPVRYNGSIMSVLFM
jgi:hypothetical protein